MEFSESNSPFSAIPKWVRSLIDIGFGWPTAGVGPRRVCLVSMPCDSAGAGLITLGALIRDLANPQANDIDGHYDRLMAYAHQHLQFCRNCKIRCLPERKGCGFSREATGKLRSLQSPHSGYVLTEKTDFHQRQISFHRDGVDFWPKPQSSTNYYIEGEPPPKWSRAAGALPAEPYNRLVPRSQIHLENLRRSFSGLCLAGRAGGENATRGICAAARFRAGKNEQGLDELLAVHEWSAFKVSRVAFFNARTHEFDRNVAVPRLVVADGDVSFLRVAGLDEFHQSDIIGVIHRTVERDRLEELGAKMSSLRQWYAPDEDMLLGLPEVPRGMSVAILKRRT